MKTPALLFTALLLTLCSIARSAPPTLTRQSAVTWEFAERKDADDTPHTTVYLHINGKRVIVEKELTVHFSVLARKDYHEYHIPTHALTACTGWWAGAGEDLYAIRHNGRLTIYRREKDEQSPDSAFKPLKSFPSR